MSHEKNLGEQSLGETDADRVSGHVPLLHKFLDFFLLIFQEITSEFATTGHEKNIPA